MNALLVGMAGVNAASAEPMLRNVAGFDVGLLAGKTCQGTNEAAMPPRSKGEWRAARVALSYVRGWLRGQSNPIGGSNVNMTKGANLVMACL